MEVHKVCAPLGGYCDWRVTAVPADHTLPLANTIGRLIFKNAVFFFVFCCFFEGGVFGINLACMEDGTTI